jgi:hypothetical protein
MYLYLVAAFRRAVYSVCITHTYHYNYYRVARRVLIIHNLITSYFLELDENMKG